LWAFKVVEFANFDVGHGSERHGETGVAPTRYFPSLAREHPLLLHRPDPSPLAQRTLEAVDLLFRTKRFGRQDMSANARPESGMRRDIEQKWGKFSAHEIAALKDNDDLVMQLQRKYQLGEAQAQRDVAEFAQGRKL
jgi:hypothetical protein